MARHRSSAVIPFALLLMCLLATSVAFAAEQSAAVKFDKERWIFNDKAVVVPFGGREALNGTAYLRDVSFLNGTVEADVWTTGEVNFAGFMFRVQSFDEYEWCWLRTHKTNGYIRDGLQYAPVFKGIADWQLNGGPGGIGRVNVPKNEWVHMKLTMLNDTASLYVQDMAKPVLVMDRLQLGLKKGSVGVQANPNAGVYFSNFAYSIDETSAVVHPEKKPTPANVLGKWEVSPRYRAENFEAIAGYPSRQLGEIKDWVSADTDASGLLNITKYTGRSGELPASFAAAKPDVAILRTYIDAERDKRVKMNFGYSDAVAIFLTEDPLYWGNSGFLARNPVDGEWISFNDAVFLNLKKGRNELLIVVADVFGGWGFQAKLDDVDGIAFPR